MNLGRRYTGLMMTAMTIAAPAKINLHLAVGARKTDGFHAIASIFQAISLADTVTVELMPGGSIDVAGDCGCAPEHNTVYRAAAGFLAERPASAIRWGARISVDKRIPMGAGLGGGSSDAAATLKALSTLLPGVASSGRLLELAAGVGSDVPFFMACACAAVRGRGELLEPLAGRQDFALVIVDPGFPISTKEAYAWLDEARTDGLSPEALSESSLSQELEGLASFYAAEPPHAWPFRNDFLRPLALRAPALDTCIERIRGTGAPYASMSGSGSACFGVYSSEDQATRALHELSRQYRCSVAFPLARLPNSI